MARSRVLLLAVPILVFGIAVAGDFAGLPTREIGAAVFLAVAPGAAITWLIGIEERAAWLALVVPVSLAIDLLVGTALVYLGLWSPVLAVAIICLITGAALAMTPFERGARLALIAVALLPGLLLVAAELAPDEAGGGQSPARVTGHGEARVVETTARLHPNAGDNRRVAPG